MNAPGIHRTEAETGAGLSWQLEDIDFSKVQPERVRYDEDLFFFLVTSSFIEAASDLYSRNLGSYYAGDPDIVAWLKNRWEREEMQHGRALRAYVHAVWPEFDWTRAYAEFLAEYSSMCTLGELEPTRGLEMAARCVVETGTSSLYRAIHEYSDEPLLKELTARIKSDEVRHFNHFYRYFQRYRATECVSRRRVVQAILKRIAEAKREDGFVAYRHAFCVRFPERRFHPRYYFEYKGNLGRIMQRNFPFEMAVKMLLKPVDVPGVLLGPLSRLLVYAARQFIFA